MALIKRLSIYDTNYVTVALMHNQFAQAKTRISTKTLNAKIVMY